MSRKDCVAVAGIVLVASLLAYGDTAVSGDQYLSTLNAGAVSGNRPTGASQECVLFRSSLQDAPAARMESQYSNAEWSVSNASASVSRQAGILSLPEPGTGLLFSIGLFVALLAGARGRARSYPRKMPWAAELATELPTGLPT